MGVHAHFVLANRAAIEDEIERLIAMLDATDAPFQDMEPEEDFGPDDQGEAREAVAMPIYAVDQSGGPTNLLDAEREQRAEQLGLVRTAAGGWRWPS